MQFNSLLYFLSSLNLLSPSTKPPFLNALIKNKNKKKPSFKNQMIPSNPKITHIISTPIEKHNLPCSSPVFPTSHNITTFQQNNKNMSTASSTVCQNLQSCLDPLAFEPSDLMHQLAPSKQALSFPWPQKQTEIENSKTEQVYVHPLVKRSSFSLSTKSLEMCTECLGSETGNDIVSNLDEFSYHALEKQSSCKNNNPAKKQEFISKKTRKSYNFPPPLTSISGNEGVQVQTRREDGRLVIKAFNFSCCRNYLQTKRENGRLKISLRRDSFRDNENDEVAENDDEEEEEEVEEENANGAGKDYCDDEGETEDDFNGRSRGENNLRDDGGKIGCKINGGDWSGGSRCNGDRSSTSKSLPSLPFCVAIS